MRQNPVTLEYSYHDDDLPPVGSVPASSTAGGVSSRAAYRSLTRDAQATNSHASSNGPTHAKQQAGGASSDIIAAAVAQAAASVPSAAGTASRGVGVDVELVAQFAAPSDTFLSRNYTASERAYCSAAADPASSLAGRWAAKEAVIKALCSAGGGVGGLQV